MKISIGSGFNKRLGYRQWIDYPMASIPVNTALGQIIGLDVVPASDGSGNYVWVVRLDNADIEIGTVDVNQTYNVTPPVVENGGTIGFQSDVNGNLKVNIAASGENATIGTVNQGQPGSLPWKVDPSGVTSPVSLASLPALAAGSNLIGAVSVAPSALSSFALTPGSSSAFETSHVLKASAGNLYSLYALAGPVAGYLMTFNATTVPPDGPVSPVECIPVPANGFASLRAEGSPPDHYSAGIIAVFSSTGPFVKTTASGYGRGTYSNGPYQAAPAAFFKWDIR